MYFFFPHDTFITLLFMKLLTGFCYLLFDVGGPEDVLDHFRVHFGCLPLHSFRILKKFNMGEKSLMSRLFVFVSADEEASKNEGI